MTVRDEPRALRYTRGQTTNPALQYLGIFVTCLETRCAAGIGRD